MLRFCVFHVIVSRSMLYLGTCKILNFYTYISQGESLWLKFLCAIRQRYIANYTISYFVPESCEYLKYAPRLWFTSYLYHFPFVFLQKQVIPHRVCWKTLCFEAIHLVFCLSHSFNATRNMWWKQCCYSSDCSLKFSLVSTFILSHSSSCDLLIISSAKDWDVTCKEMISSEEEKTQQRRGKLRCKDPVYMQNLE